MQIDSPRLSGLIARLDAMGPKPALFELAGALEAAELGEADIRPFIKSNPHHYNRATVVLRDEYELLVMTWRGGQASVPHDHGGSICAMLTVLGEAVEESYTVAPDGYVDLEYQQVFPAGQVTAGQDAAVHTVRNRAEDLLVTVHIYSPPLRDFRRFTARPAAQEVIAPSDTVLKVAIVGGGFSGSMTAAQLLRNAKLSGSKIHVILLEQRGSIGEGLAYSSPETCHLLNVPAGRMSAWPDQPGDFVRWATDRRGSVSPDDFLPRQLYGQYIRETLLKAAAETGDPGSLRVVFDEVRRITHHPSGGWMLNPARGASVRADTVVLAIGHRSPSDPTAKRWTGPRTHFIADPWKMFAMNAVGGEDSVLILGSGLTAVDAVMSLQDRGHTGPITLLSRRGLLPQPHLSGHPNPVDLKPLVVELTSRDEPVSTRTLFKKLRQAATTAASEGIAWQRVVDGLRPHIALLWSRMPMEERRRFLSHLRPYWEVHRHRMPLPVAEKFHRLRADKRVGVMAGRLEKIVATASSIEIQIRDRARGKTQKLTTDWIVNATGPSPSNSAAANPAVGSLLIQGLLCPDELNLGVKTATDGAAIGTDGNPVDDLFVVGTLRKPELWESTAVPELRTQAALAAQRIVAALSAATT